MSERELAKRVQRYHTLTQAALKKIALQKGISPENRENAKKLIKMARDYFADACHFEKEQKFALALAAFSYAHAWLDCGVKLRILDGAGDDCLFTLP